MSNTGIQPMTDTTRQYYLTFLEEQLSVLASRNYDFIPESQKEGLHAILKMMSVAVLAQCTDLCDQYETDFYILKDKLLERFA